MQQNALEGKKLQTLLIKKAIYWLLDDNNPRCVAASFLIANVGGAEPDCLARVYVMKYDHLL